ncbi:MAG: hypothetical protein DRN99_08460 [Thermoproteota archaeon]|nr:MAG: hypothetical protein DRN99_08460 [Candidatus Korarchaeota archaeon]
MYAAILLAIVLLPTIAASQQPRNIQANQQGAQSSICTSPICQPTIEESVEDVKAAINFKGLRARPKAVAKGSYFRVRVIGVDGNPVGNCFIVVYTTEGTLIYAWYTGDDGYTDYIGEIGKTYRIYCIGPYSEVHQPGYYILQEVEVNSEIVEINAQSLYSSNQLIRVEISLKLDESPLADTIVCLRQPPIPAPVETPPTDENGTATLYLTEGTYNIWCEKVDPTEGCILNLGELNLTGERLYEVTANTTQLGKIRLHIDNRLTTTLQSFNHNVIAATFLSWSPWAGEEIFWAFYAAFDNETKLGEFYITPGEHVLFHAWYYGFRSVADGLFFGLFTPRDQPISASADEVTDVWLGGELSLSFNVTAREDIEGTVYTFTPDFRDEHGNLVNYIFKPPYDHFYPGDRVRYYLEIWDSTGSLVYSGLIIGPYIREQIFGRNRLNAKFQIMLNASPGEATYRVTIETGAYQGNITYTGEFTIPEWDGEWYYKYLDADEIESKANIRSLSIAKNDTHVFFKIAYTRNMVNSTQIWVSNGVHIDVDFNEETGISGYDLLLHVRTTGARVIPPYDDVYAGLYIWAQQRWIYIVDIVHYYNPGGDFIVIGAKIDDIGTDKFRYDAYTIIHCSDRVEFRTEYEIGQVEREIVVDGYPSDWSGIAPCHVDASRDVLYGEADFTDFYLANNESYLFIRWNTQQPPLVQQLPGDAMIERLLTAYFDVNMDGEDDYIFSMYFDTYPSTPLTAYWNKYDNNWVFEKSETTAWCNQTYEVAIALSDLNNSDNIAIEVSYFNWQLVDWIPRRSYTEPMLAYMGDIFQDSTVLVCGDTAMPIDVLGAALFAQGLGYAGCDWITARTYSQLADTERSYYNLISIGGPIVNPLSLEIMLRFNITFELQDSVMTLHVEGLNISYDITLAGREDICIIYMMYDGNRTLMLIAGYYWQGTYAGCLLASRPETWSIYPTAHLLLVRWKDSNGNGLVELTEISVEAHR